MPTLSFRRLAVLGLAALLTLAGCQRSEKPPTTSDPGQAAPRSGTAAPAWPARTVRVQDGDSLIVSAADGRRQAIRLSGIDAPERRQPHAEASRRHLRALVEGRELEIRSAKRDGFGRLVAQVQVVDDRQRIDVGLAQLEAGMAWYFRRYERDLPAPDRNRYAAAEAAARGARTGLWAAPEPEPPWRYRQREAAEARR